MSYKNTVLNVKRNFLILGLTGYTGSGCSLCSDILSSTTRPTLPNVEALQELHLLPDSSNKNQRQKKIFDKLKRTWESDYNWKPFKKISISRIIFWKLLDELSKINNEDAPVQFEKINLSNHTPTPGLWNEKFTKDPESNSKIILQYESIERLYIETKSSFTNKFEFINLMQNTGDNIRKYGSALGAQYGENKSDNIYILPEATRRVIKSYYWIDKHNNENPHHFVIDAFRNPFEIEYFKWRYSEFYLIGLSRNKATRETSLDIPKSDFAKLASREEGQTPEKRTRENIDEWFASQNIDECMRKCDVFIDSNDTLSNQQYSLKFNLIKLLCLAKNPGCLPPTSDERNMQLAMTAKQMSGCISRQVGASISNKEGFIVGIGWNDPPAGQTPCSLRTGRELVNGGTRESFSEYELSDKFISHIKKTKNCDYPFCFRECYAEIDHGKKKNEFTRALHAEENAFFQALRNQGSILDESTLYTTSRTCTLCAKKAYQLGISRIVYIEDYTDIAIQQTLNSGIRNVIIEKFQGITGAAYFKLFSQVLPEKDIIQMYT